MELVVGLQPFATVKDLFAMYFGGYYFLNVGDIKFMLLFVLSGLCTITPYQ